MSSTTDTIDPTEPLTLPDFPDDIIDDDLHALVKSIESSVKGDIKWGAKTYKFALRVVYIAVTSDRNYTLSDLTAILDDTDHYHKFYLEEDAEQFSETIGTPLSDKQNIIRTFLVDQFKTICDSDDLTGEPF